MAQDDKTNESVLTEHEKEAAKQLDEQGDGYFKDEGDGQAAAGDDDASATAAGTADPAAAADPAADGSAPADPAAAAADPAAADEGAADEGAADEGAAASADDDSGLAAATDPFTMQLQADASREDIEQKIADLDKGFDEGDVTALDYRTQSRILERQLAKTEMTDEFNTQANKQSWDYAEDRFFAVKGNEVFREDPVMRGAIAGALQDLYDKNEHVGKGNAWCLEQAAKAVREQFPNGSGVEDTTPKPLTIENTGRGGKSKDLPQTLSHAPAAQGNDDGGEFAHMAQLDGIEHEMAFAKLTEAQQERYLEE